ncbi:MAG: hypothetical protein WC777_06210 [Candidatus Gracilibacteria bacterium]|jgi:hypothetical protein
MAALSVLEQKLHQQFSEYGQNAREWMRKCELLLPEIQEREIWRKKRFSSIYEYAAKLAGMSKVRVDESLRIYSKIKDKPLLMKVAESKGLQRLRPVALVATQESEAFWAEKASGMSKLALQTFVHDYRLESRSGTESQSVKVQMDLSPSLAKDLAVLKGQRSWEELMSELLELKRQVSQEAQQETVTPPAVPVATPSRHIPAAIQREVLARSGGLCAYPSCRRPATSLHHTQRWGLEKIHDPARLQAVCTGHERLVHLGLIEHEEEAPEQWRLREQADRSSDKFYIDTLVSLYRPSG